MKRRRGQFRGGLVLFGVYVASVVLANVLTARYGLIPVFPGLVATAGTIAIGGAIMTRDLVQDVGGRGLVLAAIVIGAALSYALSTPRLAIASGVTFLLAETIEMVVYTPLRRRVGFGSGRWCGTVAIANTVGAIVDTVLFLSLAGFSLTWNVMAGQLVGKAYVTVAVVVGIRALLHRTK